MTILNAITSNESLTGFSSDRIEMFAQLRSIDLRGVVGESSLKDVELLTADCYKDLLTAPDFKEGSLSITYDRGQLEAYVNEIGEKYSDDRLLKSAEQSSSINDKTETW